MNPAVTIGLLVNYTHGYYRGVLNGIRAYADAHPRWQFMPLKEAGGHLKWRSAFRPAGIIASVNTPALARALARWRRPLVNVSSVLPHLRYPRVAADGAQISRLVARHLRERGLRHFAFVGHPRHVYSSEREQSFRAALRDVGANVSCFNSRPDQPFEEHGHIGYLDRRAEKWLLNLPKPVGIMAANDRFGVELTEVCHFAGVLVPDEAAIVGVSNDPLYASFSRPPLSSVVLPSEKIGYEAAALLDRLIAGERPPTMPLLIPPSGIAARRSSDVLAIDDPDVIAAVRFIRDHAHAAIRIADVAEHVSVGRRTLERRFLHALGRSLGDEIRRSHLERACRLIAESSASIEALAEQAGYANAGHLGAAFRKELGLSPTAYRRQQRVDAMIGNKSSQSN